MISRTLSSSYYLRRLLTEFAAVRRRVKRDPIQARDDLQIEVAERTQQASLLNLTHDPIFVRDMSDVITYWNRGAQELYGWTDKGDRKAFTGVAADDLSNATRGHRSGVAADQPLGGRA